MCPALLKATDKPEDDHALARWSCLVGSHVGRLTWIEMCSAIATLAVIAATALVVCLD
jgi:hypothetical protein